MTDQLTDEAVKALLDGATENAYDLEVVKWGGGIRCVYLNDYRVAGEKPWGGGDTTRRFKVRMADIMRAFRGTVQAAAPDLAVPFLTPAPNAPPPNSGRRGCGRRWSITPTRSAKASAKTYRKRERISPKWTLTAVAAKPAPPPHKPPPIPATAGPGTSVWAGSARMASLLIRGGEGDA
jgi:hypothetical protein